MSFLAMLLALGLQRLRDADEVSARDDWLLAWQARVVQWQWHGAPALALAVLLPALLAGWLLALVEGLLFGLLWIVLAALLLWYALGRRDFDLLLARYRDHCHKGDFQAAWLSLSAHLECADEMPPASAQQLHARVQRAVFYRSCQRWFAVILYFFLLGPAAALAYRLLQLSRHHVAPALVERCLFYADWLPARLLAATFVLSGDFVRAREPLLRGLGQGSLSADALLHEVGSAALGGAPETGDAAAFGARAAQDNRAARDLLRRSALSWVAVIALLVLID